MSIPPVAVVFPGVGHYPQTGRDQLWTLSHGQAPPLDGAELRVLGCGLC